MENTVDEYPSNFTRGYWRSRTEQQLLDTIFDTSSPELLNGISCDIPPDKEVHIELAYSLNGRPEGRARCVFCKWSNHYNGFVVRHRSGSRHLVGKDCGFKLFGVDWSEFTKEFDAARDLASYLRRRNAVLAIRDYTVTRLAVLQSDPCIDTYDDIRRSFREVLPGLYHKLATSAAGDGQISIEEKTRDFAAEEKRDDKLDRMTLTERKALGLNGKRKPIFKFIPVPIGHISGKSFFKTGTSPRESIKNAASIISDAFTGLENGGTNVRTIKKHLKQLKDAVTIIEDSVAQLRNMTEAFEAGNLALIARWATNLSARTDQARYVAEIGTLRRIDNYGERVAQYPAKYRLPNVDFIGALLEAFRTY